MASGKRFDRAAEDVGGIIAMEHINITVPDQTLATLFYVNGLGLTRDPYIDFGPTNVWINAGNQQFHLPTKKSQVIRGHVGLVLPDLKALAERLHSVEKRLIGTRFSFQSAKGFISVTCPWGNKFKCYGSGNRFNMKLGIPYVEFVVPPGTTKGIARFYEEIFRCKYIVRKTSCQIAVGRGQSLRFKENQRQLDYDGHHIAIYVSNFSTPHAYLHRHGLITEESDAHQYRFQTIIDPSSGKKLFDVEHEVRSLHHPMYGRFLVNRNASQSFLNYQQGLDSFRP